MFDESDYISDTESSTSFDKSYLEEFRAHLSDIGKHVSGSTSKPLFASFIAPSSYWNPREKDAFFHALSVHSRQRPDLISECVGSKTIFEVCSYIDLLDKAAGVEEAGDAEMRRRRKALPRAMEVSDTWIDVEETQAENLIALEPELELKGKLHSREQRCKESLLHDGADGTNDEELSLLWKRDDILAHLGKSRLETLDRILRNAEDELAYGLVENQDREQEQIPTTSVGLLHSPKAHNGTAMQDINPNPAHMGMSNDMITQQSLPGSSESPERASPDENLDVDASTLSPTSKKRLRKRLHMRRKRAEAVGAVASASASRLKPGRKGKKNLLEKKSIGKRKAGIEYDIDAGAAAERTGSGLSTTVERMDVNQDAATVVRSVSGPSTPPKEVSRPSPAPKSKRSVRIKVSGLTRTEKASNDFLAVGVDTQYLRTKGLGMFHLSRLGRIMKLYNSLHKTSSNKASAISSHVIAELESLVIHFIVDVVRRAILAREMEKKLKSRTKVWRVGQLDYIYPSTVEYVLEMMGLRGATPQTHFRGLLERLKLQNNDATDEEESSEEEIEVTEQDNAEPGSICNLDADGTPPNPNLLFPLHRGLFPAVVRLRNSMQSRSAKPRTEEDLLEQETDEEELDAVLEEEEELDEFDEAAEDQYEEKLWRGEYAALD